MMTMMIVTITAGVAVLRLVRQRSDEVRHTNRAREDGRKGDGSVTARRRQVQKRKRKKSITLHLHTRRGCQVVDKGSSERPTKTAKPRMISNAMSAIF